MLLRRTVKSDWIQVSYLVWQQREETDRGTEGRGERELAVSKACVADGFQSRASESCGVWSQVLLEFGWHLETVFGSLQHENTELSHRLGEKRKSLAGWD